VLAFAFGCQLNPSLLLQTLFVSLKVTGIAVVLVEGSCKFVVAKRFKGSGMRWKLQENIRVLRVRVEKLNGNLHHYFTPQPQKWIPESVVA
jgi:hypothetical protein